MSISENLRNGARQVESEDVHRLRGEIADALKFVEALRDDIYPRLRALEDEADLQRRRRAIEREIREAEAKLEALRVARGWPPPGRA